MQCRAYFLPLPLLREPLKESFFFIKSQFVTGSSLLPCRRSRAELLDQKNNLGHKITEENVVPLL